MDGFSTSRDCPPVALWLGTDAPEWLLLLATNREVTLIGAPHGVQIPSMFRSVEPKFNDPRRFLLAARECEVWVWGAEENMPLSNSLSRRMLLGVPSESWLEVPELFNYGVLGGASGSVGFARVLDVCSQSSAPFAATVLSLDDCGEGVLLSQLSDVMACAAALDHGWELARATSTPRLCERAISARRLGALRAFHDFRGTVTMQMSSESGSTLMATLSNDAFTRVRRLCAVGGFGIVDLNADQFLWSDRLGAVIESEKSPALANAVVCTGLPESVVPLPRLAALCESVCLSAITGATEHVSRIEQTLRG